MKIYPPTKYRRLRTTGGGVDEFMSFFTELTTRWVKVECLQAYDETGSPGYDAFTRGDYAEAARLVREMVLSQRELYDYAAEHGVPMTRVRVCEVPLSPYLRHYEIPAYLADIECGEDVRFVSAADIRQLIEPAGISDFVLFDDQRVITLIYDQETASLKEALLVEDPELVKAYSLIADQLIQVAVPMLESSLVDFRRQS